MIIRFARFEFLLIAMIALVGCEKKISGPVLEPSGERPVAANGSIRGRVDFGTGSYPQTLVIAARIPSTPFTSEFTKIQLIGTLTGWNTTTSPYLRQLAPGTWVDTLSLPPGAIEWKFRTEDDWDEHPDYGKTGSQVDGLENTLEKGGVGGDGGNLKATVGASAEGLVLCTLVETPTPAKYRFQKIGLGVPAAFTSTVDGSFTLADLPSGSYNILILMPGNPRQISSVSVAGTTDLGTISLVSYTITASAGPNGSIAPSGAVTVSGGGTQRFTIAPSFGYAIDQVRVDGGLVDSAASYTFRNVTANHTIAATFVSTATTGAIQGTLLFDPAQFSDLGVAPFPPTLVELYQGTTFIDSVTTVRSTRAFSFTGLPAGEYRIVADAHLFSPTTRDTIAVGTIIRDIGDLTLAYDFAKVPSQMNLLGSFNGWPPPATGPPTEMGQIALGVWQLDHAVTAGEQLFKFVTDGFYDNPTDFGGDESVTLTVPISNSETRLLSGTGTAIKATFPSTGTYRFTLDERRQTFTIELLPAPGSSARRAP